MSQASEDDRLSAYMLFRSLAPKEAGKIGQFVEEGEFLAGEHLCREGEPGDTLYIIQDGAVEIRKKGKDGSEQVLATLGQYAMIGEMSLITNAPRSASAVATEMTRVYKIRKRVFHEMLRQESLPAYKICYAMARVLAHRMDQIDRKMVALLDIHAESEALKEMQRLQAKLASENPLLDDEEGELF